MSSRKKYHVTPHPSGGWQVKPENGKRAISKIPTKAEAMQEARQLGNNNKPVQIIYHGQNGKIQGEHSYGSDPFPPKG